MAQGRIKFIDRTAGYGYVIPDSSTSPQHTVLFKREHCEDAWVIYREGLPVSYRCSDETPLVALTISLL